MQVNAMKLKWVKNETFSWPKWEFIFWLLVVYAYSDFCKENKTSIPADIFILFEATMFSYISSANRKIILLYIRILKATLLHRPLCLLLKLVFPE